MGNQLTTADRWVLLDDRGVVTGDRVPLPDGGSAGRVLHRSECPLPR